MLTIRAEQMKVFQPVAEAAFIRRLAEYLRAQHGKVAVHLPAGLAVVEQLPAETLRIMARNGVERARRYGFTHESTLVTFVSLMFVIAPNFDSHPLIERCLKDERVPEDERFDRIWERTSEQNWQAAKQNYEAAAWGADLEGAKPEEGAQCR